MKAAYDCGVNFFDCAEAYAGGESEVVMGEAIKKFGWKRNDLVISTKVRAQPALSSAAHADALDIVGLRASPLTVDALFLPSFL